MSSNTLVHRMARVVVRPLVGSAVQPNHITMLRLLSGLAAVVAFAHGSSAAVSLAGAMFVMSGFLDRADGELARLGNLMSPGGHRFDLVSDAVVNALAFIGIGLGLWRSTGAPAWALLGVCSGVAVALIFWLITRCEEIGLEIASGGGSVDADDILFILGPAAWFGQLELLILAAAIGAPMFAFWVVWQIARYRKRDVGRTIVAVMRDSQRSETRIEHL